jgi:hypothetical protein
LPLGGGAVTLISGNSIGAIDDADKMVWETAIGSFLCVN